MLAYVCLLMDLHVLPAWDMTPWPSRTAQGAFALTQVQVAPRWKEDLNQI